MDTELLKTFLEVSATRHFGRAAENLCLTQSAVSFRVRQLESLLGVELFVRHRNNIRLTQAGEALHPLAESSVRLEHRIREEVSQQGVSKPKFEMGALPNLWESELSLVLGGAFSMSDGVCLTAVCQSTSVLIRCLLDRTLDLAFMLDPPKMEELQTLEVRSVPLALVSAQDHQVMDAQLMERYLLMDWGQHFVQQHKPMGLPTTPDISTNSIAIAREALFHQGCVAYMPEVFLSGSLGTERLYEVAHAPRMACSMYASFHHNNSKRHLIDQVVSLVRQS